MMDKTQTYKNINMHSHGKEIIIPTIVFPLLCHTFIVYEYNNKIQQKKRVKLDLPENGVSLHYNDISLYIETSFVVPIPKILMEI
jgi:hypothetical protein